MLVNRSMFTQILHTDNIVLLNNKKKQTVDRSNMEEFQNNYTEQKKPNTKEFTLYYSIYIIP